MPIELGDSWLSPKCIKVQPQGVATGVELLEGMSGPQGYCFLPNSEYRGAIFGSEQAGVSSVVQEGNSPDHQLRSLS